MTTEEVTRSKLKILPLADRVVVQREEAEERTSGGILLPDSAREKLNRGRVLAVGDGKMTDKGTRVPLQVRVGDQVLFCKYVGDEVTLEEEECFLVRESDILAVFDC